MDNLIFSQIVRSTPSVPQPDFGPAPDINSKASSASASQPERGSRSAAKSSRKCWNRVAIGPLYEERFDQSGTRSLNTNHNHRYGHSVHAHDGDFVRWLREQAALLREDFLFAREAYAGWHLSQYDASCHRSEPRVRIAPELLSKARH
jgi:hypothetical protein